MIIVTTNDATRLLSPNSTFPRPVPSFFIGYNLYNKSQHALESDHNMRTECILIKWLGGGGGRLEKGSWTPANVFLILIIMPDPLSLGR
jgi:hypothetical protein